MRLHLLPLPFLFLLFPVLLSAQTDSTQLLRSFTVAYENDFLTASFKGTTDYYYTGGTFIEFNLPCLRKNPVAKILLKLPKGTDKSFGISFNNLAFTPTSIVSDNILLGDRPFCGTLYVGLNRVSLNDDKLLLLTSRLDLGVIGPAALGYETQTFIHAHTGNLAPHGWQFQIGNDLYANYSVKIEKGVFAKESAIQLIPYAALNTGTIYTNAIGGIKIHAAPFNYFEAPTYSDRLQPAVFANAECRLVGRDATLQGGLFNTNSVYIITPEQIRRTVFACRIGTSLSYRSMCLEYSFTFLSPEFSGGRKHSWGHMGFSVLF